ncbi:flagellar assembly protein FliH [Castellaniella sp. GW247-6E4]|uniref:flagellar assembly protein FliH n=1 Tax=Castellaniella sp. GW247-6E4 TaxID=3140380 RepID=UPI0033148189
MSKSRPDLAARAAWQRWEMDSLETLKPRAAKASEADGATGDWLRQRAEALAQARERGLSKGYEAGFEQGRREGHAEGLARGLEEGRREGLETGERDGRALGLRTGHDEGAEAAREQARRLLSLTESCARSLDTLEGEVGQALVSLSVRIAEQVLRASLRDHPNRILDLVGEVLQARSAQDAAVQLRLHPEDVSLLRGYFDQDPQATPPRLIADERITRGGCILETAQGAIDATLETRWRRVIAALGQPPGEP